MGSGYSAFARHYDALTGNIDYKERARFFTEQIREHMPQARLVLDLACGTGSLAFELENSGFEVIGADASGEMLSAAYAKKAQKNSGVLFLRQAMEKLDLFGTVDATVCALDSINHAGGRARQLAVFKRVSLFTNPGGLFIFDSNTPCKHREILGNNTFVYELPRVFCCWRNGYLPRENRVDITLDFFSEEKPGEYTREQESFSEWALPEKTVRGLLAEAGFAIIHARDAETGAAPRPATQRIVYLAKKL